MTRGNGLGHVVCFPIACTEVADTSEEERPASTESTYGECPYVLPGSRFAVFAVNHLTAPCAH